MTEFPKTPALDIEIDSGWMTVWFNDPDRRNPLTAQRVSDIRDLCDALSRNRNIRGVTFRGRGGIFCAGGDLKGFQAAFQGDSAREDIIAMSIEAASLFDAINELPQLVVMAVEGAAMAGGLGLMCTGDVVIAGRDVKFAFSETRIGIPPAQIAPFVLARVGQRVGRRLMLTGSVVSGQSAIDCGLIDMLVADTEQMEEAIASVKYSVLKAAPGALAVTKALIRELPAMNRHQQVKSAAQAFTDCLLSDEGREGVASFLEKRKPDWAEENK